METESQLIKTIIEDQNSQKIVALTEKLESNSNFILSRDVENLKGIWELRWSSSNSPFLNYSPILDNLQILDPIEGKAMNLLKPKGIKAIIGTVILAKIEPINNIRIRVQFTKAGLIGPSIGFSRLKALVKIKKKQLGWLDITYMSDKIRICRGDKGTLFILMKRTDEVLFERFKKFIDKFY